MENRNTRDYPVEMYTLPEARDTRDLVPTGSINYQT